MTIRNDGFKNEPVIVIGSGIAGLLLSIELADAGCKVKLLTKGSLNQSNTAWGSGRSRRGNRRQRCRFKRTTPGGHASVRRWTHRSSSGRTNHRRWCQAGSQTCATWCRIRSIISRARRRASHGSRSAYRRRYRQNDRRWLD